MHTRVRARKVRSHVLPIIGMPRCCAHISPIKCRINSGTHRILGSHASGGEFCGEPPLEKGLRRVPNKT